MLPNEGKAGAWWSVLPSSGVMDSDVWTLRNCWVFNFFGMYYPNNLSSVTTALPIDRKVLHYRLAAELCCSVCVGNEEVVMCYVLWVCWSAGTR